MGIKKTFKASGRGLVSLFPMAVQKRGVIDLAIAFAIGLVLLFLNLVVNYGDRLQSFFGNVEDGSGTRLVLNVLFLWLALLLWIAFVRWRNSNRRAIELDAVLASISPDALLVVDRHRQIQLCNISVQRMFGYEMEEVVGQTTDLLYSDRRSPAGSGREVYDALEQDGFHVGYAEGRHRDGRRLSLEIISGEVRGGQGAVLLLRDIGPRVEAEEERRTVERRLQQRQKLESIGVLAGGIAHDFNNLLMVVLGNVELLEMQTDPRAPARRGIDDIRKAANRAAELCHQMLAYAGKAKFVIGPVNLVEVVREIGDFHGVTVSKKVRCVYDLDEAVPIVQGDAAQIRQIVMNLLTNASDAIGDAEGTIEVAIGQKECDEGFLRTCETFNRPVPGPYVFLRVSDSGCGMDETTRKRLFEPFFTTKMKGRGLGMASVQGILHAHAGAVRIETALGRGTTFTVFLPATHREEAPQPADVRSEQWVGSGKVLLVDDEEELLSVTSRMLELIGYEVMTARDGREGVDTFTRCADEVVCVVLDVTMPRMSGTEALSEIRNVRADVPVLLESGYSESLGQWDRPDARLGFIEKPYSLDDLRTAIRNLVEG